MRNKPKADEKSYKVDYHLLQVIYFDKDHVFTGPEFARIWSGFRVFGEHQAVGAFWRRKGDSFNIGKEARCSLGSLEFVEPMLDGSNPIYGGGTVRKGNLSNGTIQDCDFYLTHKDPSRWEGVDIRPDFTLAVSGQWFEKSGIDVFLGMVKEHFELSWFSLNWKIAAFELATKG
jgi:hypothetical protein